MRDWLRETEKRCIRVEREEIYRRFLDGRVRLGMLLIVDIETLMVLREIAWDTMNHRLGVFSWFSDAFSRN